MDEYIAGKAQKREVKKRKRKRRDLPSETELTDIPQRHTHISAVGAVAIRGEATGGRHVKVVF